MLRIETIEGVSPLVLVYMNRLTHKKKIKKV